MQGIIPPLITPLLDQDTLDTEGMERLVQHVLAGGVHGLFILGTTGEGPSLSYRLRRELIELVCRQVDRRVPVVVGITDTAFVESVDLSRHASDHGAAAVVAATPYYFPAGQPELIEYFTHLSKQVALPLVLYNMPGCTKLTLTHQTVVRLMDLPGVVGLKDSSGDMAEFHRLLEMTKAREGFDLLIGSEQLLAESVLFGAAGGVCGGANLEPRLYVELYEAARASDLTRVRQLHARVMALGRAVYEVGSHGSSIIKGLKSALACRGVCSDFMAEPFHRFREPQRAQLEQRLRQLDDESIAESEVRA